MSKTEQLLRDELEALRSRHEALQGVLSVARRVLGCRRSDPEMHNRLTAFSTALRQYERDFGLEAAPSREPKQDAMLTALQRILAEPYGCAFCDSGKLRNPAKDHDENCGFALARAVVDDRQEGPTTCSI